MTQLTQEYFDKKIAVIATRDKLDPLGFRVTNRFWLAGIFCGLLLSTQACTYSISWQRSNEAGVAASQQGKYAEAEKYYLAALKEAESFAPKDPRLAASLNNLATLYDTQGKYAEAEPLYQRSLAILEKALGPEHPLVATSLENYAALLRNMNREAEAAQMEARAKAIREKAR